MESLLKDIRYGLRTMIKSRGFTAVAVLSLAIGIGANTAIFSLVNAALLSPLPYKNPDSLIMLMRESHQPGKEAEPSTLWSYPKFEVLRDNNQTLEHVAAVSQQNFPLTNTDNPERLSVEMVSANYFSMLGVEAARGRTFSLDEDKTPGTHPVAVISHSLWQRRFASSPNMEGQVISLNKVPLSVIGVMPEGFKGQRGTAEVWTPMMMAPQLTFPRRLTQKFAHWFEIIARLKPGVTMSEAQADLGVTQAKLREAIPIPPEMSAQMPPDSIEAVALKDAKTDPAIKDSYLMLFAAVGFVLLIACVNIANLLMSRNSSRRKEIALRLALGATRGRLVRQLLTESVLLSVVGGAAGLLLALWGIEVLSDFKPMTDLRNKSYVDMLDFTSAVIDNRVLGFNLLLSIITGVFFGLLPALQASKPDLSQSLKEGAHGAKAVTGTLGRFSARNLLVVAEIALALVLLVGAGLMIRSLAELTSIPTGFNAEDVITLRVELPKYKPSEEVAFNEQLLSRVSALAGVEAVSVASSTPLSNNSGGTIMKIRGGAEGEMNPIGVHSVGPDYFKVLGIELIRGRTFTDSDREGAKRVVIINEEAARRLFPGEDPIGKEVWLGVGWEQNEFGEIVGVAANVKYAKVEEAFGPQAYTPYLQPTEPASFLIVRTAGDPAQMVPALRREILALDTNVPIFDLRTMEDRSRDSTSQMRFRALLLSVFSALALLLAAAGIYGVMSYMVAGRTHEIGIRMALGAQPADVMKMIISDAVVTTLAGIVIGIAAALALTRLIASQLYEVSATDAATFIVVSLVLTATALLACAVPARRATKVDPMIALRYE